MALDRQLRVLVKDRVDRSVVGKPGAAARALLFASFLATLAAVGVWAAAGGTSRNGRLYSPGHVSAAHASFENDCAACHAGDGGGGFRAQVTDAACLACHDGSIHHPGQLVADSPAGVSRAARVLAIADATRPAHLPTRSADCASCHREHRGDELLAGTSDDHCLVCHADLAKATKPPVDADHPPRKVAARVVAFDKTHPAFGARLLGADAATGRSRLVDPTRLKFNHRKHLTEVAPLMANGSDASCVRCHELPGMTPPATAVVAGSREQVAPPYRVEGEGDAQPASLMDGAYVAPIRFERHCVGCHQLEVPDMLALPPVADAPPVIAPHRSVADVRTFLAAHVGREMRRPDADFEPVVGEDEDVPEKPPLYVARLGAAFRELFGAPAPATTREQWMLARVTESAAALSIDVATDLAPRSVNPSVLPELLTARVAANQCAYCHDMSGGPPAAIGEMLTAVTVPTGIPDAPRRWFPASVFDHRAHRDMSCVECHNTFAAESLKSLPAGSAGVEETSFVNSPNLTWDENRAMPDGGTARATRSCVECHHADTWSAGRGAPASCATCHDFHDRTREHAPSTRPAMAARPR